MAEQNLKAILPSRQLESHKGDYGHLFVLAGSVGMTGAAYLCAQAGVLMGSGLVTLGIPKSLNPVMEIKLTEAMTLPLPETGKQTLSPGALQDIINFIPKVSGLAIGPGISQDSQTRSLIIELLKQINKPFVLDADGINAVAEETEVLKKINPGCCVITPHPGEMARLLNVDTGYIQNNRKATAVSFAEKYNLTVVLKGYKTLVADFEGRTFLSDTGNPGMAGGGTGDVLTGIIGSLLSQGISAWDACRLGVYLHGSAGDLAAEEKGMVSLTASDILNKMPEVIKSIN